MREVFDLRMRDRSWAEVSTCLERRYARKDLLLSYFPLVDIGNVARYFGIPPCRECASCDAEDCAAKSRLEHRARLQAMIDLNMRQDAVRRLFQRMTRARSRGHARE
jgi:hypothetical protein